MTVSLPGLRQDDSLGFLAAIGLLALSEQEEIAPLRLAWERGVAVMEGTESAGELADQLRDVFARLVVRQAVIPGISSDFPVPKKGSKDPMRMTRSEMAKHYEEADRTWLEKDNSWMARWLVALTAQTAVKATARMDVELTPFYAPTGQMALRTSIFEKTMDAVQDVNGPGDALTFWRRTAYDGANYDQRAKRDAGVTTYGKANNQGAPSATWLAAMGIRFFPMSDSGTTASTVAWQRVRLYPGYTRRSLVWPIWESLLDPAAVRFLLVHPAIQVVETEGRVSLMRADQSTQLEGLGVSALFGASRATLTQGDGPLGPSVRIWPSAPVDGSD